MIDAVSLAALDGDALTLSLIDVDAVDAAVAVTVPDGLHDDVPLTVQLNDVVIDASTVSDDD